MVLIAAIGVGLSLASPSSVGFAADPTATAGVPIAVQIPGGAQSGAGSGAATPTPTPSVDLTTQADGSPIPPAHPTDGAKKLELDHETISEGEWMLAIGHGYTPGEKVQFVLYPGAIVIGSFVADGSGDVRARFLITERAHPGNYTVEATGWQSGTVANADFQIVAPGAASVFPFLWWVLVVLGVILLSLTAAALYFRRSLRSWFAGSTAAAGAS